MINCPKCGNQMKYQKGKRRTPLDKELHQATRRSVCSCGFATNTVEVLQSELSDLRRRAYLFDRGESKYGQETFALESNP